MSAWVRATVESSGETIYLNLDHADRMQRQGPNANYTSVKTHQSDWPIARSFGQYHGGRLPASSCSGEPTR
jgi:hypothetical protein